jgi:hypothetical protein
VSETWGGDAIPRDLGNLASLLSASQDMPVEAIDAAVRAPGRIVDPVLAALDRIAADGRSTERDRNLVFWGLHVLAQARETRLCPPLLRLLRLPTEPLLDVLAEAVDSTLPRILIATYDGDADALEAAILDPEIDELARYGLFGALAFLTFSGRIGRERTHGPAGRARSRSAGSATSRRGSRRRATTPGSSSRTRARRTRTGLP